MYNLLNLEYTSIMIDNQLRNELIEDLYGVMHRFGTAMDEFREQLGRAEDLGVKIDWDRYNTIAASIDESVFSTNGASLQQIVDEVFTEASGK